MSDRLSSLEHGLSGVKLVFTHKVGKILLAIVAGSLLQFSPQFPASGQPSAVSNPGQGTNDELQNSAMSLGVVRSPDNADEWDAIASRIQAAGLVYQVIDLEQLQQQADRAGVTVLLLPNIARWTPQQVLALESLMSQGVRAIASGPVGTDSAVGVATALRSLMGAYWRSPLPQPSGMKRTPCQTELLCPYNWVPQEMNASIVKGGVLVPSNFNSQIAAIWLSPEGSPAVVITERTTFFGWEWGMGGDVEFDSAWLRAALLRTEGKPRLLQKRPVPTSTEGERKTGAPAEQEIPTGEESNPQTVPKPETSSEPPAPTSEPPQVPPPEPTLPTLQPKS